MKNLINLTRLFSPPSLALDVNEVKAFLKIEHCLEDALLNMLILAATEKCERYTGIALLNQTWNAHYENVYTYKVRLPVKPANSIQEITIAYSDGMKAKFNPRQYTLENNIVFLHSTPAASRMQIKFECGFGDSSDSIPADIKSVLLEHVAYLYEQRDQQIPFNMRKYDEFKEIKL
jgi:uncharacterized phiE125 gp8 family phage protein